MFCSHCGASIQPLDRFCPACGYAQAANASAPQRISPLYRLFPAPAVRRAIASLLAAVLVLLCLAIAAGGMALLGQAGISARETHTFAEDQADDPTLQSGSDQAAVLFTSFTDQDPPYFAESAFSQGYARVERGSYVIAIKPDTTRVKSAINLQHTAYRIETRLALEQAADESYAGILVRAVDNDGNYGVSFEIAANGAWRVTTEDPFTRTEIILPWTESAAVRSAPAANVIVADVAGRTVVFSANGRPIFTYEKAASVGSYIALLAGTSPTGTNVLASFDYVLVREPYIKTE
jgi:hypothetical protein